MQNSQLQAVQKQTFLISAQNVALAALPMRKAARSATTVAIVSVEYELIQIEIVRINANIG